MAHERLHDDELELLQSRHHEVLRAAEMALDDLPTGPYQAFALVEVGAAWAEYVTAYEEVRRHGVSDDTDLDWLEMLQERLEQACLHAMAPGQPPPEPESPAVIGAELAWQPPTSQRPRGMQRRQSPVVHGISWLERSHAVNAEPMVVYIWADRPALTLLSVGLSTADLFLTGRLDAGRLASSRGRGCILRVEVPAGIAVDVLAMADHIPANLQHRLRESSDTYLIPVGLLSEVAITDVYELDGRGGFVATHDVSAGIGVGFAGADHGVPGLPNDVVRWPHRARSEGKVYLVMPEDPRQVTERLLTHPGWLPVFRERPIARAGFHILVLRIGDRHAIDLPATVERLAEVALAQPELRRFTGLDLLLPAGAFGVAQVHSVITNGRPHGGHPMRGQTLQDLVYGVQPHGAAPLDAGWSAWQSRAA